MTRLVTVGAAQLGPIALNETRPQVVERLIAHLQRAAGFGCDLVVFPELALTTFFPRWYMEDQAEVDAFFERSMPNPEARPLFDEAERLGIGFYLGYAELAGEEGRTRRFNTSILVGKDGAIIGKFRKVHLPGHAEHEPERSFQHLEKRYFEPGQEFPVWRAFGGIFGMCICNDRRWAETYRVMGLQGVEMILVGYNTPLHYLPDPERDAIGLFQNHLLMQAGAHQNATFVVGVAKCGNEEGVPMIGGSCIIDPSGQIVALAASEADELVVAACDLDRCTPYKETIFNFALHREPAAYGLITERKGAVPPPE